MVCVVCGLPTQLMRHEIQLGVQALSLRRGETLSTPKVVTAPLYYVAQPESFEMLHPLCSAACGLRWNEAHP